MALCVFLFCTLRSILAHLDAFGVDRACVLLEELGDAAAVPVLEAHLAKSRRKAERTRLEIAIATLGGRSATAAPTAPKKKKTPAKKAPRR